ncbi:kinase-like domain-containing protein [Polychytrium aggregatum]|uniref:kinase-like domain-containing protein n=1 Tax=Polychytrium aggregatum TaxID=110093 RepID=UPI0022FEDBF7|nr:kinase-like domain-containing protein [Polychytrium aggregatum]KAI9202057.1 kinase-like domain-containing protein [Polychytrium aggregatum]
MPASPSLFLEALVDPENSSHVYEARRTHNNRTHRIAVKVVAFPSSAPSRSRLVQEIQRIRSLRLHNPNVVTIFEAHFDYDAQTATLCMQYHPLKSLHNFLYRSTFPHSDITAAIKYGFIVGIAQGLHYLHQNNIVHGNLKSQNVLLKYDTDGTLRAQLSDYGLSAVRPALGDPNLLPTSTLVYTAPECLEPLLDSHPGAESDVYGFAMLAYEVWFLAKPFDGLAASEIQQYVSRGNREPLPAGWVLSDLLSACWDALPDRRPDIEAVCSELNKRLGTQTPPPIDLQFVMDLYPSTTPTRSSLDIASSYRSLSSFDRPDERDELSKDVVFTFSRNERWLDTRHIPIIAQEGNAAFCLEYPDPLLSIEVLQALQASNSSSGSGQLPESWTIKLCDTTPQGLALLTLKKTGGSKDYDFVIKTLNDKSFVTKFERRGLIHVKHKFKSMSSSLTYGWTGEYSDSSTYHLLKVYPSKQIVGRYDRGQLNEANGKLEGQISFKAPYIEDTILILATALLLEEPARVAEIVKEAAF